MSDAPPAPQAGGEEKLSKAEQRRRRKAAQKAAKQAAKAKAKAEREAKQGAKKPKRKKLGGGDDAVEPWKYFENRKKFIASLESDDAKLNPYPHKFKVDMDLPSFRKQFDSMEKEQRDDSTTVSIAGRIVNIRSSSAKLVFYTIQGDGEKIQAMCSLKSHEAGEEKFYEIHDILRRGDIVGMTGSPGKTKTGELSIFPKDVKLLSPCLRMLPKARGNKSGLTNQDTRYRKRYLDLICNESERNVFAPRAKCINYIRRYLDMRNFLEVETPILNMIPGGATALPFTTVHNELKMQMFMRIAPELYLKTLIIGGLDRVYEIGRQFRNEGMDMTHNPEFTTCEFYMAYADYHDLMDMTEEMIRGMVYEITGSYKLTYHPNRTAESEGEPIVIDFEPPFERVPMVKGVEERGGFKIPPIETEEARIFLDNKVKELELECHPRTTAKLLDKLVGYYIEDNVVERPTFIIDHPELMSPLAKYHRSKSGMTERFELFINGKELCNAYTELNNPRVQRQRFDDQAKQKAQGDDEAQFKDENFCEAMEYGLPPTGGWGLGIDRLTMFLTDNNTIKEVLLFPAMKPEEDSSGKAKVVEQPKVKTEVVKSSATESQAPAPAPAVAVARPQLNAADVKMNVLDDEGSNFHSKVYSGKMPF